MTSARLDILTAEDAKYVPFAKSLLYRAHCVCAAQGVQQFARHYPLPGGGEIFIRIWEGGDYIRVRAGGGTFLVAPFVRKISTDTTTEGTSCFLNRTLTKATVAPVGLTNATGITVGVPPFKHDITKTKHFTGRVTAVPTTRRGYFTGKNFNTAGADSLTNYAGVFRHSYDKSGVASSEFLHARATIANPTTSAADGLYYHTPALGDQLCRFLDFSLARRPAVHESMYASPSGRKVVTEEQFFPGNTLGFADWFIVRSIIDIDLGNTITPVTISDYANLHGYPSSTFEARGSGQTILVHTTPPGGDLNVVTGQFVYPISTIINLNDALEHAEFTLDFDNNNLLTSSTTGALTGPGSFTTTVFKHRQRESVLATFSATSMAAQGETISDTFIDIEYTVKNFDQSGGPVPEELTLDAPLKYYDKRGIARVEYSDASIPAMVYSFVESTIDPVIATPTSSDSDVTAVTRALTSRIKNVAVIGSRTITLSDESLDTTDGPVVYVNGITTPLLQANIYRVVSDVTLPDTGYPNKIFCPNRNDNVVSSPNRQFVQFAALDKTAYIGSALLSHDPASVMSTKWYTFSHSDAALKKTIVNYVLSPATPIAGAALEDYEIWFTAIRAI